MPTTINTPAVERSTYVLTADFTDETGAAVVPNAGLNWTLMTKAGRVINSRLSVPITPASSITIVLSGDDLALVDGETKGRRVLIEGTYDSDLGAGLAIRDQLTFSIVNLTEAIS